MNKHLATMVAQNKELAAQLKRLEKKKPAKVTVNDKSGHPKTTARETARRLAMAG